IASPGVAKKNWRRPMRGSASPPPRVAQVNPPRVFNAIAITPIACTTSVAGFDSNWTPRTATRVGPASAKVTFAQAERCDLITKREPQKRLGDDQSIGGVALTDMEPIIQPRW